MGYDMSLKLNHRHPDYNPKNPDVTGMYDNTGIMLDRAESVLDLLQVIFIESEDNQLPMRNGTVFANLCVIQNELQDVREVLRHFHDSSMRDRTRKTTNLTS